MANSDRPQPFPLSAAQMDVWIGHHLDPTGYAYNIGSYLTIGGPIDEAALREALRRLTTETETLRVRFIQGALGVQQLVEPDTDPHLTVHDLTGEEQPEAAARDWMWADLRRPVSLCRDSLSAFALFKASEDRFFLYQRVHHVALDAYGAAMVTQRLAEIYTALIHGRDDLKSRFGSLHEVIREEDAYRSSARFQRDRDYWTAQLAGWPAPATLGRVPAGAPDGADATTRSSVGYLGEEDSEKLTLCANTLGVPWWAVFIAGTASYLHHKTGRSDIVLSLPVHGRATPTARKTPAMVANVLPVRMDVRPSTSHAELTLRSSRAIAESLRHQRYRFEDIRRDLGHRRDPGGWWPVVNVMDFGRQPTFDGLPTSTTPLAVATTYDLSVSLYGQVDGKGLRVDLNANAALHSAADLNGHHKSYLRHVRSLVRHPEAQMSALAASVPN